MARGAILTQKTNGAAMSNRKIGIGHNGAPSLRDEIQNWLADGGISRGAVRDNLNGALFFATSGDLRGARLLARRAARSCGDTRINKWAASLMDDESRR